MEPIKLNFTKNIFYLHLILLKNILFYEMSITLYSEKSTLVKNNLFKKNK